MSPPPSPRSSQGGAAGGGVTHAVCCSGLVTVSLAKRAASTMRKNAVAIKEEILRFVKTNTDDYEVLALWSTVHRMTPPPPPPPPPHAPLGTLRQGAALTFVLLASLENATHCIVLPRTCVCVCVCVCIA